MQLEVGNILEGKVTGITKFGAFIELSGGKTGMVHISEVASSYVKEISDHLTQNQVVKVKVIGISPEGKVSLSIKQANPTPAPQPAQTSPRSFNNNAQGSGAPARNNAQSRRPSRPVSYGFERRMNENTQEMSFEDMMARFKQTSDDKISDLKKYTDAKRGSAGRRGQSK